MSHGIRRGTAADVGAAASVLAAAFVDSPWTQWTVAADRHTERIAGLQRLVLERAVLPFGELWIAATDARVVAAALWMDPHRVPQPAVWEEMEAETAALEGDRHEAAATADLMLAGLRPSTPHFFLGAVGVLPDQQRQGIGTRLLTPVLERADDEMLDAYLETSTAANVEFYLRLGFTVTGECQIPDGGPPVWAMTRTRRADDSTAR